jgi:EAL domain-containing protein (putative c-di-GMP-specific phosphodiesterase class I)
MSAHLQPHRQRHAGRRPRGQPQPALALPPIRQEGDTNWQLSLVGEMDNALDHGDIWVAYQPQFTINNLRIIGAEALVRWQHPERGSISPETFVLAAEEHNRILRLTLYVLERATSDALRIVSRRKTFRLSVNLGHAAQLPDLPRDRRVLKATQFPRPI